jgi:hypothetical protein
MLWCSDDIIIMMRTTLNLPDDVIGIVKAVAEANGLSFGDAAAKLIRRGLQSGGRTAEDAGIPCFAVPGGAPPIMLEHTLAVEDDL